MQLTEYNEIRSALDAIKSACDFLPDTSSDEGYKKAKRVALDGGKVLTKLEGKRKELKAESLEFGRNVDSQAKTLKQEIEGYLQPHKDAYKALDNEKKEREANRKAELEQRVQDIRELPETMRDSDSSGVKMAMEAMQAEECLGFYEYSMQALEARNAARVALGDMYAQKLTAEKEAAELEELRQEKAKRDQEAHEESIRREASAKADREKEAAVKALADAELGAQHEVALVMHEAFCDEARRVELQRVEDEAKAAREADKKHIGNIRREVKEALMENCLIDEATAKTIVLAISRGDIAHTSIKY